MNIRDLLLAMVFCLSPLTAHSVYDHIELLPFDPTGYFATEKALDRIFSDYRIDSVIELGCWAGASTRFFGRRVGEEGTVYAIDHWLGTPNYRPEMTDPRLPYIYQLFLSNIIRSELTEQVVPIRMTTHEAHRAFPHIKADLIYVDAARDEHGVYADILTWHTHHLNEGGIICGAEWREPGVQKGVKKASRELGLSIERDKKGFFWILR